MQNGNSGTAHFRFYVRATVKTYSIIPMLRLPDESTIFSTSISLSVSFPTFIYLGIRGGRQKEEREEEVRERVQEGRERGKGEREEGQGGGEGERKEREREKGKGVVNLAVYLRTQTLCSTKHTHTVRHVHLLSPHLPHPPSFLPFLPPPHTPTHFSLSSRGLRR